MLIGDPSEQVRQQCRTAPQVALVAHKMCARGRADTQCQYRVEKNRGHFL
jgi:hypothetical protein